MTEVGWREWVHLPNLDIGPIKAKLDTGARTSSLHAYDIQVADGVVDFKVHTVQGRDDFFIAAQAPLVEEREVRDSGGNATLRPIVSTTLTMLGESRSIELSLIDRRDMNFRMLIGRTALAGFLVNSHAEYIGGVPPAVRNWKP